VKGGTAARRDGIAHSVAAQAGNGSTEAERSPDKGQHGLPSDEK